MMPMDVMPIVFLAGTDYEMGYQYGKQLAEYIPAVCEDAWVLAVKRGDAKHPIAASRGHVLKDIAVYRKLLQKHAPEQLEQIRGMVCALSSAGKRIEESDILLIQSGVNRRLAAEEGMAAAHEVKQCCSWSAWGRTTKGGQLICSDSNDGDFMPQVCLIVFPDEGSPYVTTAKVGELSDHFAYSFSGLFFGDSGGDGRRLCDWGYGLRWPSVIQHCVRFARSAEEAERMICSWPHAVPENYHLVDKSRVACVVELTADLHAVRRPHDHGGGEYLYATNNFVSQAMRAACDPTGEGEYTLHAGWPGNAGVSRNLEIWQMLTDYHGLVDLEFAKMMWRFPGSPPPLPPSGGWRDMICRLSNSRVGIVLPDVGEYGEVHICTGPVGRVIYQFRRETFPIQGAHAFARIPLASSADGIVEAMYGQACDDVASSHHALSRLSDSEPRFFGLREIQAKAHAEVYLGKESYYRGLLSTSCDRLALLSAAASALARAQVYATELKELILPPPTSPDQMGLLPWKNAA